MNVKDEVRVEVFSNLCGGWVTLPFNTLCSGTIFRLYEKDGTRHQDQDGNTVWIAGGSPAPNKDGILEVQTLY